MARKTILIIKHGFSETCDHHVSPVVSYGDVFRCTCLLEDFKGWHVTWITAKAARDLLTGNPLIDKLILADSPDQIGRGELLGWYDQVVNLEKQRDWCEFAAGLPVGRRYGFRDWTATGADCFYPESAAALSAGLAKEGYKTLQDTLFETVGRTWQGQRYVLGHQPRVAEIYDVGLNNHVGPKWPNKVWPGGHWESLHERLAEMGYAVCWQQSLNSLRHYMDWLASCRLVVTCDSLGLHLALGLRKKVVGLFGPTLPQQIYMYGLGAKLTPACDRPCVPCMKTRCDYARCCMEHITPKMVAQTTELLLGRVGGTAPAEEPASGLGVPWRRRGRRSGAPERTLVGVGAR